MNLTLELSGLNLERLLRAAGDCGVRMKNVRRMDERTMRVVVPAAQKKRMAALCEKYGWQMAEIRAGGLLRLARGIKRRWTLGLSVLLSIFWVYLSSEMIWRVEIDGAGENAAEVRRCLEAENARVGRLKRRVSTDHLADALALAVPGLAHAAARYEGSTLVVDCQRAREGEWAGVAGQGAEIVAAREGVVVRISAESGTPRVKPGQAVRKGQTLISGQERTGGGETRACRAQVHAGGHFAASLALVAERAFLHRMLLVRRSIGVAYSEVHRVRRLLPIEGANARIGAGRDAHTAADALVVILADDTRFGIIIRCANGAHLRACGVFAMLATHGDVAHLNVGERALRGVGRVAAIGQSARPENAFGHVIGDFARRGARIAAHATLGVNHHSVVSH